jgi:phosphate starvation-inducible protein PhoH and related proteins
MSDNHKLYELALRDRALLPTIAVGPAGTGKTYGAVGYAVEWLEDKRKKVLVTRPNVSFAKETGFLPGTEREKMAPWVRPIEQNFKFHGFKTGHLAMLEKEQRLVYMPLEYIQGLTWDDTLIIVDEVQNMSFEQMKVFLTRTGKYSKVVMCGDVAQTSPKFKQSGLSELLRMVEATGVPVHTINFTHDDILRSEQCKLWIESFDAWEEMTHGS